MTIEQINDYLEKRIAYFRTQSKTAIVNTVLKELEAIHKLTNVIQSRSSQEIKVK